MKNILPKNNIEIRLIEANEIEHGLKTEQYESISFIEILGEERQGTINKDIEKILKEFEDIFEKPPPGLPPMREGVTHTIDLILGSEPPFKSMYRLTKFERVVAQETDYCFARNA